MAILEGFEVRVVVDGEDLNEFENPSDSLLPSARQIKGRNNTPASTVITASDPPSQGWSYKISKDYRTCNSKDAKGSSRRNRKVLRPQQKRRCAKTTRLVEAAAGETFIIRFSSDEYLSKKFSLQGVEAIIIVDGKEVDSQFLTDPPFSGTSEGHSRYRKGELYIEPFQFAKILIDSTTTPGQKELGSLKRRYCGLGTITVEMYRIKSFRAFSNSEENRDYRIYAQNVANAIDTRNMIVPEKAIKGKVSTHRTCFEEAENVGNFDVYGGEYMDGRRRPYLTFEFHCVSKESLQQMGLIHREPSLIPLGQRDPNELTREEMLELLKQKQARIDTYEKVKREGEEFSETSRSCTVGLDDAMSITTSRPAQRLFANGEVVDLMDD